MNVAGGDRQILPVSIEVLRLRDKTWKRIVALLGRDRTDVALLAKLRRVCLLASSSRGGTSVTAEMFQWQGANCEAGGFLTLPGEEKPHLILSGLAFPARLARYYDLDVCDANVTAVRCLMNELVSEIGTAVPYCHDLLLYSLQLYRRLLLQWPLEMVRLSHEGAIQALAAELHRAFPGGYVDTPANRKRALGCCVACFPFIRLSFYDRSGVRRAEDIELLDLGMWSFEEPPFVFPPPWHHATDEELARGMFLLRDPSNAWRLPFWSFVFQKQKITVLHLIRDAAESVQGLCDGWNYPYGFQTIPSDTPLMIHGYVNTAPHQKWKRYRLNFSVDRSLSEQLLGGQPLSLVSVCREQWRSAHERILSETQSLGLVRIPVHFGEVRREPVRTLEEICDALGFEASRLGVEFATSFGSRWVMTTAPNNDADYDRWKYSRYASEIAGAVAGADVVDLASRLGL